MTPARKLPLKSGWGAKMVASIPNDARWLPYTAITKKTLTWDLCTRGSHTKAHSQSLKTLHKDFHHIGNARQTRSSGNQIATIQFFEFVVNHDNCHPPLGSRLKQLAEIETTITE